MKELKEIFDDGHKPGSTKLDTTVVRYEDKQSPRTVCIFDDVLEELWQSRIYEFSVARGHPWGIVFD